MQADRDKQFGSPVTRPQLKKKFLALIIVGILALIALYFLFPILTIVYVVQPVRIEGHAMAPTLKNGDKIFVLKSISHLNRGDIVVFLFPHDQTKSYIKRIIGLPGETIEIKEGKVIIDGKPLDEPYLDSKYLSHDTMPLPVVLPPDQYFVLGDNRSNSSDSRVWGTVPRNLIYGKYWYRYWAANKEDARGKMLDARPGSSIQHLTSSILN